MFTLPHELNPLILASERNKREFLNLLFDATAQTLLAFGRHELSGRVGFTLVLHTWDQQLRAHFHVHCLIVVRKPDLRWSALGRWRQPLSPFAGPEELPEYLGRYTHRVAISNHRIVASQDGQIQFRYRDCSDGDCQKLATLAPEDFIRRFLQHVLPSRFLRIRHYGFLANCLKNHSLHRSRQLLGAQTRAPRPRLQSLAERVKVMPGIDITLCPCCRNPPCSAALRQSLDPPSSLRVRLRLLQQARSDTS